MIAASRSPHPGGGGEAIADGAHQRKAGKRDDQLFREGREQPANDGADQPDQAIKHPAITAAV